MTKYRVVSKIIIHDILEYEEAFTILELLREKNPDNINVYHIEKCDDPEKNRLGRDPDLH
jgi:FtsZ-interacting cell division protein YlmF|tara:strand:+ start:85 stop:264 length:180 start_codon:yes stop_codon:yes gene_type:complete